MSQGYIKLHRQLQDHWLWKEDRTFSRAEAWIDLLLLVNHSDAKTVFGTSLINIKKGSRITSIRQLCDRWNWSNTKVKRFLELLQSDGMIVYKSDAKKTVVTIVNWDLYQCVNDAKTTQKRRKNVTDASLTHTNKNEKNEKNEKNDNSYTPYKKIMELYNDTCHSLSSIKTITGKRQESVGARWKEYGQNIEVFKELFTKAEASDFLTGRIKNTNPSHKNFKADFDWLMTITYFPKVLEGKYDNDKGTSTRPLTPTELKLKMLEEL